MQVQGTSATQRFCCKRAPPLPWQAGDKRTTIYAVGAGTSGGGGSGTAADGIGSGGTGGGSGGGGAGGNIDGEPFIFSDIDDLWGCGGDGGSSEWGGVGGERGDYGASGSGDDTGASRKYAKVGGSGSSCAKPKTTAFYTYKNSDAEPQCTSIAGTMLSVGKPNTREATLLGTFEAFKDHGGYVIKGTDQPPTITNSKEQNMADFLLALLKTMPKVNKPSVQAESVQTANTDGTQGLLSAESSNELHAEAEGDVTTVP